MYQFENTYTMCANQVLFESFSGTACQADSTQELIKSVLHLTGKQR